MSRRSTPLFVLLAFMLAAASGCVAVPVSSTSTGTGTPGSPIIEVETASVPSTTVTAEQTAGVLQPTVEMLATATETPARTETPVATPAATATVTTTGTIETTAVPLTPSPALQYYRGPNPYRATPLFEVAYDPSRWQYVEDDGTGRPSQLKHREMDGCAIWLRAGPVDAKQVGTVWLAERAWSVAQVQPKVIEYVSPQEDFAWIFGVLLSEEFTGRANSNCQDAAEQVIGTFRVVPG